MTRLSETRPKSDESAGARKALQRREILWSYVFISPQLILYLLLFILPLVIAIPLIFTDQVNYTDIGEFIGFQNFITIAENEQIREIYLDALFKTLAFAVVNYALVMALGFALALAMYEYALKGSWFTIIFLPYMLSGLGVGFLALVLFSESTGTINLLLQDLGLIDDPLRIKTFLGTIVVLPALATWRMAGFFMAMFLAGLLAIPTDIIDASEVDGASYLQRLRLVYFPQMKGTFLITTTFAIVTAFNTFDELVALGALFQNKSAEFLSIVVFKFAFLSNRLALGMTIAVITFVPLMLGGLLMMRYQRRIANE